MNTKIAAIAAVIVIVAAGVGAYALLKDDDGGSTSSKRQLLTDTLQVYGNADGNWTIDGDDVDLINDIIKKNSDDDSTNDIDWSAKYPFADADHNGKIEQADADQAKALSEGTATHVCFLDGLSEYMDVKCNPQKIYAFQVQNAELCAIMGVGDNVVAGGPPIKYYADLFYGSEHAETMEFFSGNYEKLNEMEIDMYLVFSPTQKATPTEKLPDTDVVYLGLYEPDLYNLEGSVWAQGILEAGYIFNTKERAEGYLEYLLEVRDAVKDISSQVSSEDQVNVLVSGYSSGNYFFDKDTSKVPVYLKYDTISQAVALAGGHNIYAENEKFDVGDYAVNVTNEDFDNYDIDFITMHFQRYAWTGEATNMPTGGYTATDATAMYDVIKDVATRDLVKEKGIDEDGLIMLAQEFRNGVNGGVLAAAYLVQIFYPELCEKAGFDASSYMEEFTNTWLNLKNYNFEDHKDAIIACGTQ